MCASHTYSLFSPLLDLSASGETVARIYNLAVSGDVRNPHSLDGDHVWHAFYLHGLLQDASKRSQTLCLPHKGKQSERLRAALQARNIRMAGTGQAQWAHACDECEKVSTPTDPSQPTSMSFSPCSPLIK